MSSPNKDPEIIRAIILDHYENPKHHLGDNGNNSKLKGYVECNISSASCIDNLTAYIKVLNNIIKDVKFSGVGCAISTSATDIMCNLLRNKTINEAKKIISNYLSMIDKKPYDEELLGELNAYCEIYKQPNRKKCAVFPFEVLKKDKSKFFKL